MRTGLLVKGIIITLIISVAAWLTFNKEVNLGLDLQGGAYILMEAKPIEEGQKVTNEDMTKLVEVMERRVNALGLAEPNLQRSGDNRIIVELAGAKDPDEAIKLIGKTALLEFKMVKEDGSLGETLLTGKHLKRADVTYNNSGMGMGAPQIAFELDLAGAKVFAKITKENIGKQLAITLDGEKQTAPTIQSEIPGGKGVITGNYTVEAAKSMAMLLNAGALPVKVELMETRTVGATLGVESINKTKRAGIIALALVAVFMIIFYRLPGLVANVALAVCGLITFGVLNFFGAVLTLPGIAGLILTLGMAVDANVIIFERIKEELRLGNSLLASIDEGFKKAFIAIIDANITTLIITAILFALGTGAVKGFAVTLSIGILASMFTAITVTRLILKAVVYGLNIKNPKLFGARG